MTTNTPPTRRHNYVNGCDVSGRGRKARQSSAHQQITTTEAPEGITHDQPEQLPITLPSGQTLMQKIAARQLLSLSHASGVMEDRANAAIPAAGIGPSIINSLKLYTIPAGTQIPQSELDKEINCIRTELGFFLQNSTLELINGTKTCSFGMKSPSEVLSVSLLSLFWLAHVAK